MSQSPGTWGPCDLPFETTVQGFHVSATQLSAFTTGGLPWSLASHFPSGLYPPPMAARSSGPCLTPPGHAHRPTDPVCLPSHPASRPGSPAPVALAACHSAPKSGHIEADTAPLGRRVTHLLNRQSTPTRSA